MKLLNTYLSLLKFSALGSGLLLAISLFPLVALQSKLMENYENFAGHIQMNAQVVIWMVTCFLYAGIKISFLKNQIHQWITLVEDHELWTIM